MVSQAIMLALAGVPGIYVHSLFGSSNDYIGVEETGRARSINRQTWLRAEIEAVLHDMPGIRDCAIFGIPDEEFGECLCAHIDVDPDTIHNEDEVREWLRERIAGFKVPGPP